MHRGIEIISCTDRNKVLNIYGIQNLKPKSENLQIPGNPSALETQSVFKGFISLRILGSVCIFPLFLTEDDFSKRFQEVTSCVCHSLNLK